MINGPCCDIQSRNVILQTMKYDRGSSQYGRNRVDDLDDPSFGLDELVAEEDKKKNLRPKEVVDRLRELLQKKGKAFLHTAEYYAAIEDQQERMRAYRGLTITKTVLDGEDAEIAGNPFKFLYLPEDATFGQTRAAYINLSKHWHPDIMRPEDPEQYDRIFGSSKFPIEGKDYTSWFEEISAILPPKTLSIRELEKLSSVEQEEYGKKQEAYRNKELEYEQVQSEMRLRAAKKMHVLNKAYTEAKKRFSAPEKESFAGFIWESAAGNSEFFKKGSMGPNFEGFEYERLSLEGEGQVRRDKGRFATNNFAYLAFDFGEPYLLDDDYRQRLYLKSFFAWTELVQHQELSPRLLEDMVNTYRLDDNQAEQLRLMIMNKEEPDFIVNALGITKEDQKDYEMLHFLENAYDGPMFSHDMIGREYLLYPVGVEFTQKCGLILTYKSQLDHYHWTALDGNSHFTPTDVQMMLAIAYGPLLQQ